MTQKKLKNSTTPSRLSYTQKATLRQLNALKKHEIVIAIDPGTITGYSVAQAEGGAKKGDYKRSLVICESGMIHNILLQVRIKTIEASFSDCGVLVIIEDARNISGLASQKLGAGSIRRDCSIWEDFLHELQKQFENLDYNFIKPTGNKFLKIDKKRWLIYSKWKGNKLPNEHARDSATYLFSYIN